jgi:hypothetical protein
MTHKVFNVCLLSCCLVTLHYWTALNDVCRINLEESLIFKFSIWVFESRTELTSCGPYIDHQVEQLTVLYYFVSSVATKTCDSLRETIWFIWAHSLPWKHVLTSCCNRNLVFTQSLLFNRHLALAPLFWLSSVVPQYILQHSSSGI